MHGKFAEIVSWYDTHILLIAGTAVIAFVILNTLEMMARSRRARKQQIAVKYLNAAGIRPHTHASQR